MRPTPTTFSLDGGDWQIKGFLGEDWRLRLAYDPDTKDRCGWIPARVPGSVQHDLWQAGEIPDPYFERNSLLIEWVPERTWVYRKRFFAPEEWRNGRLQLQFAGVDYEADFYLNGQMLGRHAGMFTPAVFEVGETLRFGEENHIAVVVAPTPREQPQVGRTSLVRIQKPRMNYWWDHCPRMIHLGIWDRTSLRVTGAQRIEDVYIRPHLNEKRTHADILVSLQISSNGAQSGWVELILNQDGQEVTRQNGYVGLETGENRIQICLGVENPRLWWPNGAGAQPLYQAVVRVYAGQAADAVLSDEHEQGFGIRQLEVEANDGASPGARPYVLRVNGKRVYLQGWNWVPMDVLYGVERPEKLARLLGLAKQAGVNLLRVWGGGLIEKQSFYDQCDRLGILVWQEFIQSSSGLDNRPAEDPEFVRYITGEARQIVLRLRNHASLAWWCGGNELMDDQGVPLDESHPLLGALHNIVADLDPGRLWLPTSPTGPVFGFNAENIAKRPDDLHDVHGPWEHQGLEAQLDLYNRGASLLHSEFGVEGITNRSSLDAVMDQEHQMPVSLDNPLWMHLGAWWVKEKRWQEVFGGSLKGLEDFQRATQYLQFDGLRYAVEAGRQRQYANAGTLPWQLNEAYPMAACTSAIDYHSRPKPAYFAVMAAYEPVHVSARFDHLAWAGQANFQAEIWASNAYHAVLAGTHVDLRILDAKGATCLDRMFVKDLPGDGSVSLVNVQLPLGKIQTDVFFLDLRLVSNLGEVFSHNRYAFSRADTLKPLLDLEQTNLQAGLKVDGNTWELELANPGTCVAFQAWVEDARPVNAPGYAWINPAYFCLLPGEQKTIRVEWQDVPEEERCLEVTGWNFTSLKFEKGIQIGLEEHHWMGNHLTNSCRFLKYG